MSKDMQTCGMKESNELRRTFLLSVFESCDSHRQPLPSITDLWRVARDALTRGQCRGGMEGPLAR
jgi:hypothetical protein